MPDIYSVGYAMVDRKGWPFPDTVCRTQRGAMVNALIAIFRHPVYATTSDAQITEDFAQIAASKGYAIAPVAIERVSIVAEGEQIASERSPALNAAIDVLMAIQKEARGPHFGLPERIDAMCTAALAEIHHREKTDDA